MHPARDPDSALEADTTRIVRWAGPAFILFSLALVPWSVYLGYTLPSRQVAHRFNIAWAGFDVLLLVVLGATGLLALRRSRYLALAAAATATMLVVDAWFDIMTSPRGQLAEAILLAACIELPLAAVCAWLSYHTEHLAARKISLMPRRGGS